MITNITRQEIKDRAKASMKGKYWDLFLVSLVGTVIVGAVSGIASTMEQLGMIYENGILSSLGGILTILASLFVAIPISLGLIRYFIKIAKGEDASLNTIFYIYKNGFANAIVVTLVEGIFIILWSLLFIVPGIIKSYQYFMIEYMIAENPNLSRKRAFEITKAVMNGNKWKTFVFGLSFIGWVLLASITCGIGMLFLAPYMSTAYSHYYLDLKAKAIEEGIVTADELNG